MGQRLRNRHTLHGLDHTAQERTTRAGQDQPANPALLFSPEALPDGTVLAVDREDLGPVAAHPFANQLACHDEHFLGCQRDVLARFERGQGWAKGSTAGGGHDHEVDFRVAHRVIDRVGRLGRISSGGIRQQRVGFRMTPSHRLERGRVAPRDQRVERESVGMPFDQVADLPANRPGCTEQRQAPGRRTRGSHVFSQD